MGRRRLAQGGVTTDLTMEPERQPAHVVEHDFEGLLVRTMLHGFYWLDDGLQAYMRKHSGISLPRAQSMMMVCIGDGIDRPSDLAARLSVSKQAVQQGLKELVAKELVEIRPDPDNGRQKLVCFTRTGRECRDVARAGILELRKLLAGRIGRDRLDALEDALRADWGPVG